ncbi:hypothetical protein QNM97_09250 [Gordonia sp. L191]|uniref:hypothetical protein n=1 Tax=Gordonia sp. L191 TaxID=2982699 RepID=UPI0024BF87C3|nr:hypothetical protein [Gordonia sp. L191]WHU49135.1 hypothetical protein QNM97_09250 [Gordonia sp. L191]
MNDVASGGRINRRRALTLAGTAGAAALVAGRSTASAAPTSRGPADRNELWRGLVEMNQLGPRLTGNAAHREFIDSLESRLKSYGITTFRDRTRFDRWEAKSFGLRLEGRPQPVAAYVPYSGSTPPGGISGELVYLGTSAPSATSPDLRDKIVVTDAISPEVPVRLARPLLQYLNDPRRTVKDSDAVSLLALSMCLPLTTFRLAGARAVVLVLDASPTNAAGQYVPFLLPLAGIPGVIVDRDTGRRMRTAAQQRRRATVTLLAEVEHNAATDDLIAVIPGTGPEISLVNTHTDGPNAIEENGPIALLALARRMSQIPKSSRRRTHVFLFSTGHMTSHVGDTQRFIGNHPDWIRRTASALTIEHLGGMQWVDGPDGYRPTGLTDLMPILTSQNPSLWAVTRQAILATGSERTGILPAVANTGMAGVGVSLNAIGVPTVALLGSPPYLVSSADNGHLDKLDPDHFHRQVTLSDAILTRLDATPRSELALGGTLLQGGGQLFPEAVGIGWQAARQFLGFAGLLGANNSGGH